MRGFGKRVLQTRKRQLFRTGLRNAVTERGVGQSISKRKLRRTRLVKVTRKKFLLAFFWRMLRVRFGPSGIESVVIQRLLAYRPRPAEWQVPSGSGSAKEHVRNRISCLHSRKPCGQHCWYMFERPGNGKRPPTEQNQHYRFAR